MPTTHNALRKRKQNRACYHRHDRSTRPKIPAQQTTSAKQAHSQHLPCVWQTPLQAPQKTATRWRMHDHLLCRKFGFTLCHSICDGVCAHTLQSGKPATSILLTNRHSCTNKPSTAKAPRTPTAHHNLRSSCSALFATQGAAASCKHTAAVHTTSVPNKRGCNTAAFDSQQHTHSVTSVQRSILTIMHMCMYIRYGR
jgi:hypothetical protein